MEKDTLTALSDTGICFHLMRIRALMAQIVHSVAVTVSQSTSFSTSPKKEKIMARRVCKIFE